MDWIKIYRITHIENIDHILSNGITHRFSPNANPNFMPIGDGQLIEHRAEKTVWVNNCGSSRPTRPICLGDYIPFYFGVKMPMLYVIQKGGNFVESATPADDIVYLVCSLEKIVDAGMECVFSDGHATNRLTCFYEDSQINNLNDIIDWPAIESNFWAGEENLDMKRKKQAEFLVAGDIPKECISGFLCHSSGSKARIINLGIDPDGITVNPNAYF